MHRITRNHIYLALFCSFAGSAALALEPASAPGASAPPASHSNSTLSTGDANTGSRDLALGEWLPDDADLWVRIRKGFAIPDLDNALVTSQTEWYAARPDYIKRTSERGSRYLYHVVEELEKRNMPTELALLPIIESSFNPEAYSHAKAAGMWQFMPATGNDFHLKQNMFKDERRDVLASTDAALTYLQRLHDQFGDWQLALAAYNWGEGSVQRLINKAKAAGQPTDYNSLSAMMPLETRNYVPKLQAVKNIVASPTMYHVSLPHVENQPYFVSIPKTRDIDIELAAQFAELSVDEFKALNPQFNRPVITGKAETTQILLPESKADKFRENLAKWGHALSSWTSHTVTAARERIDSIASRFKTTPEKLREVNHLPANAQLRAGSTILVPKTEDTPENDIAPELAESAVLAVEPDAPAMRKVTLKVGRRDTLAGIAARNHVTVSQIKAWNGLHHDRVAVGQTLQIQVPVKKGATHLAQHHTAHGGHTVAHGRAATHHAHTVAHNSKAGRRRHA